MICPYISIYFLSSCTVAISKERGRNISPCPKFPGLTRTCVAGASVGDLAEL